MNRTCNLWPAGLVLAFALFFIATVALIAIAASQRSDLVCPDYYQQELRYQTRLDALNRTAPFAKLIRVETDPAAEELFLSLPPQLIGPETAGRIEFYRPAAASLDRTVRLQLNPEGAQRLNLSGFEPGLWKVRVFWRTGPEDYLVERNLVLKRPGPEAKPLSSPQDR